LVVLALVYLCVRWVMHHAPNHGKPVPWNSLGVALATVGIVGATVGVGVYARFSASLGAAVLLFGTAIVILLWLYLCFLALLWGAVIEADRQRSVASGPKIEAEEDEAEEIEAEEIEAD
jgi:membrane protein